MLRAVPSTVLTAALRSPAVRSGILSFAMASTCFMLILPTLFLLGSPLPLAIPASRLMSTATGGVLVMNVYERSAYTVITTGMMRPSSLAVLALKALQKSMMFTPACPRAGPTGGAGVALPAGIWSLICPTTFFMKTLSPATLELFHLEEIELHRGGASENRDHHLQGVAVEVDLFDDTLEVREGTVDDTDALPALEGVLRLGLLDRLLDLVEDLIGFLLGQGDGPVAGADEARDLGRVLHE